MPEWPDRGHAVEVRCMLAFSLWIGNRFMAAEHGSRTRGEVLELVLAALVSPRPSTS